MSKTIKTIEITFENTEYVAIPMEYFESYDHKKSDSGIFHNMEEVSVDFTLKKEVIGVQKLFDYDIHMVEFKNKTIFDRVCDYSDICSLTLSYSDGSKEKFIVEWEDDESEFKNKFQTTTLTENGDLRVVIKRR